MSPKIGRSRCAIAVSPASTDTTMFAGKTLNLRSAGQAGPVAGKRGQACTCNVASVDKQVAAVPAARPKVC